MGANCLEANCLEGKFFGSKLFIGKLFVSKLFGGKLFGSKLAGVKFSAVVLLIMLPFSSLISSWISGNWVTHLRQQSRGFRTVIFQDDDPEGRAWFTYYISIRYIAPMYESPEIKQTHEAKIKMCPTS